MAKGIKKQNPAICYIHETLLGFSDRYLRVKVWAKVVFHSNGNRKQGGVAILLSDKTHFKLKLIIRDKRGHFILIKETVN